MILVNKLRDNAPYIRRRKKKNNVELFSFRIRKYFFVFYLRLSISSMIIFFFFFFYGWSINSLWLCLVLFCMSFETIFFLLHFRSPCNCDFTSVARLVCYSVILINVWIWINHERVKIAHLNFIRQFVSRCHCYHN